MHILLADIQTIQKSFPVFSSILVYNYDFKRLTILSLLIIDFDNTGKRISSISARVFQDSKSMGGLRNMPSYLTVCGPDRQADQSTADLAELITTF